MASVKKNSDAVRNINGQTVVQVVNKHPAEPNLFGGENRLHRIIIAQTG